MKEYQSSTLTWHCCSELENIDYNELLPKGDIILVYHHCQLNGETCTVINCHVSR